MNKKRLKLRCNQPIESFRQHGKYKSCTEDSGYTFIDRGGSVLAVAHTDTVLEHEHFISSGHKVFSVRLDDRLGVYTLLDYLPGRGLKFDVLLTEDEEIGQSTAQFFETKKDYNWMFQFDRRGIQTVMYQYETPELVQMLKDSEIPVGYGTFSDISYLDELGITGFNFASGYHNEHMPTCHMLIPEWQASVNKFVKFFEQWQDVPLAYTRKPYYYRRYNWDYDDDLYLYGANRLTDASPTTNLLIAHSSTGTTDPQVGSLYDDTDYCELCGTWFKDAENMASIWETDMCVECLDTYDKYFSG